MPAEPSHLDLSDLRDAIQLACQPTHGPKIIDGRRRVAELPREWVLENIEAIGRSALNFAHEEWGCWEYGRFLELLDHIGAHELLGRMVREGLASEDVDVREIGGVLAEVRRAGRRTNQTLNWTEATMVLVNSNMGSWPVRDVDPLAARTLVHESVLRKPTASNGHQLWYVTVARHTRCSASRATITVCSTIRARPVLSIRLLRLVGPGPNPRSGCRNLATRASDTPIAGGCAGLRLGTRATLSSTKFLPRNSAHWYPRAADAD